ncbi:MAG: hypothetical protein CMJ18_06110 [Phycisphaeraceae bacterium]|nr:hypothetical protein [Phycisphaeraceae bacterium]
MLAFVLGWTAHGGAIMPKRISPDLPEEIRSLAGIDRVRLTIADLPDSLKKRGLKKAALRRRYVDRLERLGITVGDDEDLPRFNIWLKQFGQDRQDGTVGFVSVISVYQSVRVHRLGRDMFVPTANFAGGTLMDEQTSTEQIVVELLRRCSNVAVAISRAKEKGLR